VVDAVARAVRRLRTGLGAGERVAGAGVGTGGVVDHAGGTVDPEAVVIGGGVAQAGADLVIGTAITAPEWITTRFPRAPAEEHAPGPPRLKQRPAGP
jgi:predicted NBD/HSP70 family sugar kinase